MTPPSFLIDGVMLGHGCSLVEEHGLFVSAVGAIKRRRFPASLCLLFLPHLHATSTRTTDSARILCISPRLPHSLHPTSVDQNAEASAPSPSLLTDECSDGSLVTSISTLLESTSCSMNNIWAARIISHHRSFLLSINKGILLIRQPLLLQKISGFINTKF